MMKKIIIILPLAVLFLQIQTPASCPIKSFGMCKVGLQNNNQTVNDKLMPNYLNKLVNPDNHNFNPTNHTNNALPETLNYGEGNQQNVQTKPYNANCQFGICLPGGENTPESE